MNESTDGSEAVDASQGRAPRRRRILPTLLARLLYAATLILVALTLLSLLPRVWWGFALLEHPRPYLVGASVLSLLVSLPSRLYGTALLGAAALLSNALLMTAFGPPLAQSSQRVNLEIIHLNLDRDNRDVEAVVDAIEPDVPVDAPTIVCLQELTPAWEQSLRERLTAYDWVAAIPRDDSRGVAVLVRRDAGLDVLDVETLQWLPDETDRPTLAVRLRHPGTDTDPFTLLSLHTKRPTDRSNAAVQRRELAAAARWCAEQIISEGQDRRLIVIGDFNATPWSFPYNDFLRAADLGHVGGIGYVGTTYPGHWPWPLRLPIDLCAVSESVGASDVHAGPKVGSDHRPLIARLWIE